MSTVFGAIPVKPAIRLSRALHPRFKSLSNAANFVLD